MPEGAILEKETSSIIVMSNAKQNIGNKYVVTREFNGSFLKNQLLSYNPYIIVKYSQGEQNRTEVHLPKHKATAYANQSLIGSNDDAYYIDRKGAYPFAIDIPMLGFTPVTKGTELTANIPVLLHGQNQWEMTVRIGIKNNRTKDNESCVECPLIRTLHLFF